MRANLRVLSGTLVVLVATALATAGLAVAQEPLGERSASPPVEQTPPSIAPREEVLPEEDSGTAPTEDQGTAPVNAEEVQQVADESNSLPFTGFVALTLLPVGLALLLAGLVLRRREPAGLDA